MDEVKAISAEQIEMMRHALGLANGRKKSFRNHYCVGSPSEDHALWTDLVARNFARRRAGNQLTGGDDLFWLTRSGAECVLKRGEKLCPEDFPLLSASVEVDG